MLNSDGYLVVVAIVVTIALLLSQKQPPHLAFLIPLCVLVIAGAVNVDTVLNAMASETVLVILLLLVISDSMAKAGLDHIISTKVLPTEGNEIKCLIVMGGIVSVLSAFLNNTAVVAVMMPAVMRWACVQNRAPGKLLMPLSYFSVLGGSLTMIGSSTNIVAKDMSGIDFGIFDIAPVGLPVLGFCFLYIVIFSQFLLPNHKLAISSNVVQKNQELEQSDQKIYTAKVSVPENHYMVGKTLKEAGLFEVEGLYLKKIERLDGTSEIFTKPGVSIKMNASSAASEKSGEKEDFVTINTKSVLCPGDMLTFAGGIEGLFAIKKCYEFKHMEVPNSCNQYMYEVILSPNSTLADMTVRTAQSHYRFRDATIIQVYRNGTLIRGKLQRLRLRPYDLLIVEAGPHFDCLTCNDPYSDNSSAGSSATSSDAETCVTNTVDDFADEKSQTKKVTVLDHLRELSGRMGDSVDVVSTKSSRKRSALKPRIAHKNCRSHSGYYYDHDFSVVVPLGVKDACCSTDNEQIGLSVTPECSAATLSKSERLKDFVKTNYNLIVIVTLFLVVIIVNAITGYFTRLLLALLVISCVMRVTSPDGIASVTVSNHRVLLTIMGALGLSAAMDSSGVTSNLASAISEFVETMSLFPLLVTFYSVGMVVSTFINNNAAVALLIPVVQQTTIFDNEDNYRLVVLAIIMGSSASFMIPSGYQTNLMVMGPGQYSVYDFVKFGIAMQVMFSVMSILVLSLFNYWWIITLIVYGFAGVMMWQLYTPLTLRSQRMSKRDPEKASEEEAMSLSQHEFKDSVEVTADINSESTSRGITLAELSKKNSGTPKPLCNCGDDDYCCYYYDAYPAERTLPSHPDVDASVIEDISVSKGEISSTNEMQ
eukprot:Nk52_evm61s210 gene=Nk52_evmTU61s210